MVDVCYAHIPPDDERPSHRNAQVANDGIAHSYNNHDIMMGYDLVDI